MNNMMRLGSGSVIRLARARASSSSVRQRAASSSASLEPADMARQVLPTHRETRLEVLGSKPTAPIHGQARARPRKCDEASPTAWGSALLVEPDMLKTPIIIDAVFLVHVTLEVGVPAGRGAVVVDDGPRHVLGENALDLPHQRLALFDIDFLRLLIEKLVDLSCAVLRVVGLRVAGISALQHRVGIIDADAGGVEGDGVVLFGETIVPDRGFDHLELGIEMHLVELVDEDHRRIAIGGKVAG